MSVILLWDILGFVLVVKTIGIIKNGINIIYSLITKIMHTIKPIESIVDYNTSTL